MSWPDTSDELLEILEYEIQEGDINKPGIANEWDIIENKIMVYDVKQAPNTISPSIHYLTHPSK